MDNKLLHDYTTYVYTLKIVFLVSLPVKADDTITNIIHFPNSYLRDKNKRYACVYPSPNSRLYLYMWWYVLFTFQISNTRFSFFIYTLFPYHTHSASFLVSLLHRTRKHSHLTFSLLPFVWETRTHNHNDIFYDTTLVIRDD